MEGGESVASDDLGVISDSITGRRAASGVVEAVVEAGWMKWKTKRSEGHAWMLVLYCRQ